MLDNPDRRVAVRLRRKRGGIGKTMQHNHWNTGGWAMFFVSNA